MAYRVDLTEQAARNLSRIYQTINAADSQAARAWFNGLEAAILSLEEHPTRCPVTPEDTTLRHLLYGSSRHIYRVIYAIGSHDTVVTVLHIRHGAQAAFKRSADD